MKTCHGIMTKEIKCCNPSDTVQAVACQMRDEDVGSILICDPQTKQLLGIVTDRDIAVKDAAEGLSPETTTIEMVMTRDPICCRLDDDLDMALKVMAKHQIRRLPIIDTDSRLVGVISQGDIATRVRDPKKMASVVREISQPPSREYQREHAMPAAG